MIGLVGMAAVRTGVVYDIAQIAPRGALWARFYMFGQDVQIVHSEALNAQVEGLERHWDRHLREEEMPDELVQLVGGQGTRLRGRGGGALVLD
jgi:hypothetical protein